MMKGVSKQILEVTNTDNPYFEKIIFFVKPEHSAADTARLKQEAEAVAAVAHRPPKLRRSRRQVIKSIVLSALFALAGGGVAGLLYTIL